MLKYILPPSSCFSVRLFYHGSLNWVRAKANWRENPMMKLLQHSIHDGWDLVWMQLLQCPWSCEHPPIHAPVNEPSGLLCSPSWTWAKSLVYQCCLIWVNGCLLTSSQKSNKKLMLAEKDQWSDMGVPGPQGGGWMGTKIPFTAERCATLNLNPPILF